MADRVRRPLRLSLTYPAPSSGTPLQLARESCGAVVRNLRPDDYFTLVVFDDSAQVVIPLQKPLNRQAMEAAIAGISENGSTNLMAGWLVGRDELLKVGAECDKKILVLTDGHLNRGMVEPDKVEALTRRGFGKDGLRTSCLGFGDSYLDGNRRDKDQELPKYALGADPGDPK